MRLEPERFKARWMLRLGLNLWTGVLPPEVEISPFTDRSWMTQRLRFLFDALPGLFEHQQSAIFRKTTDAYAWMCHGCFRAASAFPHAFPACVERMERALRGETNIFEPDIVALADLLTVNFEDGSCGLNRFRPAQAEVLREAESSVRSGAYEHFLTPGGREKFAAYQRFLEESTAFRREWAGLKELFQDPARRWPDLLVRGLLRRDPIPERNWQPERGSTLDDEKARFRAVFSIFCWKWFLWAMDGDQPLLMKPSVNVTALGTQIFIPGYMSLDAKRDLDLAAISRLHKARGVLRGNVAKERVREWASAPGLSRKEILANIRHELPHFSERQVRRWLKDPCADKFVSKDALHGSNSLP